MDVFSIAEKKRFVLEMKNEKIGLYTILVLSCYILTTEGYPQDLVNMEDI